MERDFERTKSDERFRQSHKMETIGVLTGVITYNYNSILGILFDNIKLEKDDIPIGNPASVYQKQIKIGSLRVKSCP